MTTASVAPDARSDPLAETIYRLDGPLRWALGEIEDLLRTAGVRSGMTILDAGAGTGYATIPAARAVGADGVVHSLDVVAPLLDVLATKVAGTALADRVRLHCASLIDIPLADSSVDLVLCTYVLHELASLAPQVLAEVYRVLRPTGRLVIADFRRTPDAKHNAEIESWYARQPDGAGPEERHLRFSLDDIERLLRGAGFAGVELSSWHDFHLHAIATK
ncbi:MAG: class I SAM-dependent methyltransferase [Pseudonocardiaceae bacterium]